MLKNKSFDSARRRAVRRRERHECLDRRVRASSPLQQRIFLLDLLGGRASTRAAYISRPVARLQIVAERRQTTRVFPQFIGR